jgi:hypothetical protein
MYIALFEALLLAGVAVRSIGARYWIGALVAAAMLYVTVGMIAVLVFGKLFPPITELVRDHASAIVIAKLVAPLGMYALARRRPAWKETGDLFALVAIVEAIELAIAIAIS